MAAQTASTVRAAALRSRCLSLAKTCSIGFRSGEYFGRKKSLAPTERMSSRTALPLWLPRLSMMTMSPRFKVGSRTFSTLIVKLSPSIGPSRTQGASIRSQRNAARKVVVFQWPCGTLAVSLVPRGAQPRKCHIGLGPGLVDKHQAPRFDLALILRPLRAPAGDVRTVAFAGDDAFFLAEVLGVDELPHRPVIDLQPALGEFGDQPAQGEVPYLGAF